MAMAEIQSQIERLHPEQQQHFYEYSAQSLACLMEHAWHKANEEERECIVPAGASLLRAMLAVAARRRHAKPRPKLKFQPNLALYLADSACIDESMDVFIRSAPRMEKWLRRTIADCIRMAESHAVSEEQARSRFICRLRETIAWCAERIKYSNAKAVLRSEALGNELRAAAEEFEPDDLWASRWMIVSVVHRRAQLLQAKARRAEFPVAGGLSGGRLLLHFLDCSNHNGITADETEGFLDNSDTPPWDTWVDIVQAGESDQEILVAWMPGDFVSLAQRAIDVECIGMLMWADSPPASMPFPESSIPRWLRDIAVGR